MIDSVRVSESGKRRLINLKRVTGLDQWNIVCRWAFCLSLSEGHIPPHREPESLSNIEMSWKVFAGKDSSAYTALLRHAYAESTSLENDLNQAEFLRLHIERGISLLATKIKGGKIGSLLELALSTSVPRVTA